MEQFIVNTNFRPVCVELKVEVYKPCTLRVVAFDSLRNETVYFDRTFKPTKQIEEMQIKMPQNRKNTTVMVFCDVKEGAFKIVSSKKRKLIQYPQCYKRKETREFIAFAQEISSRFPYLNNGRYFSKNRNFEIEIYGEISGTGTPARIHNGTGVIQMSKAKMGNNTVPMTMAILLHEYSHFFENQVQVDEIEADLNALRIYMGLNYPIMESHKTFTEVFDHSDTPQNRERYDYIYAFVDQFDKIKHKTCI